MDERLQFVARRLAVNYKIIRQRRETGSVKQTFALHLPS